MGTSQSSPGPRGNTPLVPDWADDQPDQPLPEPEPARFQPFRQALGRFVRSGDSSDLKSALGHYAGKGSGGGGIAARRLGPTTKAGAALYNTLTSGTIVDASGETIVNLSDLTGQPCEIAIDIITRALTTDGGDADKIRAAMNLALINALDGIPVFDPSYITDDIIVDTMIAYLAESVFLQIVMDAGMGPWTKAETPAQTIRAENDLRELIGVVVDDKMASLIQNNVRSFTANEMIQLQRQAIHVVWDEWRAYQ